MTGDSAEGVPGLTIERITVVDNLEPAIELAGSLRIAPPNTAPLGLQLIGPRQTLEGTLTFTADSWHATIPLLASIWNGPRLPPRSGGYRLSIPVGADDGLPVEAIIERLVELPIPRLIDSVVYLSFDATDNGPLGLAIIFSAPLTEEERGQQQQARLEAAYRAANYQPANAVFFESFYGQNASCNPLAIDRALSTLRPDVIRYWSIQDASVPVPPGSVGLIEGSEEWWRARGSARLLVVNDWLRKRFRRRRYQTVLQTWHGTPLKRIALSRSALGRSALGRSALGRSGLSRSGLSRSGLRLRPALATIRERSYWNILLAQNRYSTRIFRAAYAYLGTIWEEGYPRDDVLVTGDASAVRTKLGISDGVTVLLYAPTWRDDQPEHVDHLDVARFADALGSGYLILIRGHPRTFQPGENLYAHNVLDVTGYPDVSELFLVADALITDYSSVMFDYTVTGKPLFFFTPDFDRYRDELRGFYFDLIEIAPGPMVHTATELVDLVRDRTAVNERYAEKYRAWQQRFNPRDDGDASVRVVRRLLLEDRIG